MKNSCPRPDKMAFDSEEECRERYPALLLTDQTMTVYQCRCGKWHAGRDESNREKNALKAVPRISTGLNPTVPAPKPARRRREVRRAEPVVSMTVHGSVWAEALNWAGGCANRIQTLNAHHVVVHEDSDWRKRS